MRKLSKSELKQLQEIELELLIEFDRICEKYNLKYFLCGGSLIGAIRHKGFIPWDDDIDVSMPRKDYMKFLNVYKEEIDSKKYFLQARETDDKCYMLMAKLKRKDSIYSEKNSIRDKKEKCIWLDIFPVDNIKNNSIISRLRYFRVYSLKTILAYKTGYLSDANTRLKKIILLIVKFVSIFYSINGLNKKLDNIIFRDSDKDTKYVASFAGTYLGKEIVEKRLIKDIIKVDFEGKKFNAPKNYDEYLRHYYGDYMQLPPKEKRNPIHEIDEIKFPEK